MLEIGNALTTRYHCSVLHGTDVGTLVKCWVHCCWCGVSVTRCACSETVCPIARCYEEVDYNMDLLTLVQWFGGQALPELSS